MNKGILYGVSVGPGDPSLMTLKAVKILEETEITAVPLSTCESTTALDIARQNVNFEDKTLVYLDMPMTKDKDILREKHFSAAEKISEYLAEGKNVAMLCLGDISVYSTFSYIHEIISGMNYESIIIPGVTSFCAAAAECGTALVQGRERLVVEPLYEGGKTEENAVTVIMKTRNMKAVKKDLREAENSGRKIFAAEKCGMNSETKLYFRSEEIPDDADYFTTVIVK